MSQDHFETVACLLESLVEAVVPGHARVVVQRAVDLARAARCNQRLADTLQLDELLSRHGLGLTIVLAILDVIDKPLVDAIVLAPLGCDDGVCDGAARETVPGRICKLRHVGRITRFDVELHVKSHGALGSLKEACGTFERCVYFRESPYGHFPLF